MYTEEQLNFINYSGDKSVILSATAGSGKTHSTVGRLNKMIEDGVDPKRIIFFSYTNDAVNELKSRINHDVKITTIHSYASSILAKMKLYKPISTFYDFIHWYQQTFKPEPYAALRIRQEYQIQIEILYDNADNISSEIASYKLKRADNIKAKLPNFYELYCTFLSEMNTRDFTDLLIETERLSARPKYTKFFDGTYDYVFVDEYQDTSTIQMKILSRIHAKQYFLIGDRNQSIFGFAGANCDAVEGILSSHREVERMTLTKNFRSMRNIVENANLHSDLSALPHHEEPGFVDDDILTQHGFFKKLSEGVPTVVLSRKNSAIKGIELDCLKKKIPLRYFNYITKSDIEKIKIGDINHKLKRKLDDVVPQFGNVTKLVEFIESNYDCESFVTSIHKSKGREFHRCIIVDSLPPEIAAKNSLLVDEYSYITVSGDVDIEAKNVHYVAVTRAKTEIYYFVYD